MIVEMLIAFAIIIIGGLFNLGLFYLLMGRNLTFKIYGYLIPGIVTIVGMGYLWAKVGGVHSLTATFTIVPLGAGILVVNIIFLGKTIVRPIQKLGLAAEAISKGDFSHTLDYESRDEIGTLSRNFASMARVQKERAMLASDIAGGNMRQEVEVFSENDTLGRALTDMVANLNDTLGQVMAATNETFSSAAQVAEASQSLSQGATQQAASLEEITSAVTELSSQTRLNAENALQASRLAAETREKAESGNGRMQTMIASMNEIATASKGIARIMKAIDDIAFQTNLLALNAAVEAARAGRHGKGFAVVAQEVRNLAGRSAKAAQETAELIETAVKKAENGTEIVNLTASALDEILAGTNKVADLIDEISSASNEQASGLTQVHQGLSQVDQVTQRNTASAEETASASEMLSGQANMLRRLVGRFKLKDQDHEPGEKPAGATMTPHRRPAPARPALPARASGPVPARGKAMVRPEDVISLDEDDFGKY
ncbi:MAG: HAMP domain-containing protein [Proteobacteria bacterium]|nr:HAMP domain-containing protein [Pseudomonadota bacterium]